MSLFLVKQASRAKGGIALLGDKSIASRSVIISALSQGKTTIKNFPPNEDCLYAVKTFRKLGIKIIQNKNAGRITVYGKGLYGLRKPKGPIFTGDSGTVFRLTLGVLAGQDFPVTLTAGKSLSQRPMLRVTSPLRMMGAVIKSKKQKSKSEEYPPVTVKGACLNSIIYKMPVASAQVKSSILLAGLYAKGQTCVIEPIKTRDHTERMLKLFRAGIQTKAGKIIIKGRRGLISPGEFSIPGDISSAAFFMVLGAILPNSRILMKGVNLNSSRTGILDVLKRMGLDIEIRKPKSKNRIYEPMGDLIIRSSRLKGTIVKKEEVPVLIDELPILMVAACFAEGKSVFEGISELRVKETDRAESMTQNLAKMGADIKVLKTPKSEKIIIQGCNPLRGASVRSFGDHRTAMSMVVAGLAAKGVTRIDDVTCINKSFPNFLSLLKSIIR
ncbi:MAG: 3-phosphoshikimate 1-carboxyvinyltransferase [Candidatus Omnitrophica bacterium]|jgi:3-phosphoshikimate 1-carboxyvinyltransferase|nr:3-phosphoshikimate 1-carboxyvinyltransferase [Candidatus Omnitrophota bacterium]